MEERIERMEKAIEGIKNKLELLDIINDNLSKVFQTVNRQRNISETQQKVYQDISTSYQEAARKIREAI